MQLTDYEKRMLDGEMGPAEQVAMELLVQYGDALGAERLVEVQSVTGGIGGSPQIRLFSKGKTMDEVFNEFKLNTGASFKVPKLKAFAASLTNTMDPKCWEIQRASRDAFEWGVRCEEYSKTIDMHCAFTCAPYLVGITPIFGEHCACMESSAISFCNSIIGARTNTEGLESTGVAAITRRIPYWGLHIKENRYARYQIQVETDITTSKDWGMLGYFLGRSVKEKVAVINGIQHHPDLIKMKHTCAAAASSGGVELFHIAGMTPEAHTLEMALNGQKPLETYVYTDREKREMYELLNSGRSEDVDFVVIGCPHSNLEEVWTIVNCLDGQKIKDTCDLWIFVPSAIKHLADRQGYTEIIERAGGHVMTDTCPAMARVFPEGTRTAATNSAKQAHYFPSLTGIGTYYGSTEECIQAAITGKWGGRL